MREMVRLARSDEFSIGEVSIHVDAPNWLPYETYDRLRLVFVRQGTYRLQVADINGVVDPTIAYIARSGDPHRIAHKVGATDLCTAITLSRDFVARTGAKIPACSWAGPTTGHIDLAQRALVARARRDADEFELTERLVNLTRLLFDVAALTAPETASSEASICTRQKIVDIARELLAEDPATPRLTDLAVRAGVSPYYLSRTFRQATGDTLSKFRNRLRVRQALERIAEGERDLAQLAADLGFSDHAHLTRTIRDEVGNSPTVVRRIFAGTHATVD